MIAFVKADPARNLEGSILATIGMSTITMPISSIIITMPIIVGIVLGIMIGIDIALGMADDQGRCYLPFRSDLAPSFLNRQQLCQAVRSFPRLPEHMM